MVLPPDSWMGSCRRDLFSLSHPVPVFVAINRPPSRLSLIKKIDVTGDGLLRDRARYYFYHRANSFFDSRRLSVNVNVKTYNRPPISINRVQIRWQTHDMESRYNTTGHLLKHFTNHAYYWDRLGILFSVFLFRSPNSCIFLWD